MISRAGVGAYRASELHVHSIDRGHRRGELPGVLYCPSRDNTAWQGLLPFWIGHVIRAIAGVGYPVLSADMGGPTTFGNDAARDAAGQARNYLGGLGASVSRVFLVGTSMGALTALRWAQENPSLVAGVIGGVPAVDLAHIHDVTRPDLAATIEAAHGGSAGYADWLPLHNPTQNTEDFETIPMQLHYSTDDTSVAPERAEFFAAETGAELISLGAVGHTPQSVDPLDVLRFMEAQL